MRKAAIFAKTADGANATNRRRENAAGKSTEGFERKEIPFEQPKRERGKSSNNWYKLYDGAMLGITSYTKIGLRIATILGFMVSFLSIIVALVYLVLKLCMWDSFQAGIAPLIIGVFLLGGLQIFFIGFLGEYILKINQRLMHRPLVVVEEKLNFNKDIKN